MKVLRWPPGRPHPRAHPCGRGWVPLAVLSFSLLFLATGRGEVGFPFRGGAPERSAFASTTPHPAVVRVVAHERNGTSNGSGTLVDIRGEQALVVTNWHVVRDATGEIEVRFPDGFRSLAQLAKIDKDWDLAALVIWRPQVQPVQIAERAPQVGELLHIAGYGSGDYRFASGRCSQYVAPGANHPYEMVEVSVQARNGDSGGPIFNEQGELAGVLFGAGGGSTSGSFCGRVRWFLESVWPNLGADSVSSEPARVAQPAATPNRPSATIAKNPAADPRLVAVEPLDVADADSWGTRNVAARPDPYQRPERYPLPNPIPAEPFDRPRSENASESETGFSQTPSVPTYTPVARYPEAPEVPSSAAGQPILLRDIIGDTRIERIKLFLAAVGCLSIWMWLSRTIGGGG